VGYGRPRGTAHAYATEPHLISIAGRDHSAMS
jgi:hypothetical protein